jgi:hypothetical protein
VRPAGGDALLAERRPARPGAAESGSEQKVLFFALELVVRVPQTGRAKGRNSLKFIGGHIFINPNRDRSHVLKCKAEEHKMQVQSESKLNRRHHRPRALTLQDETIASYGNQPYDIYRQNLVVLRLRRLLIAIGLLLQFEGWAQQT